MSLKSDSNLICRAFWVMTDKITRTCVRIMCLFSYVRWSVQWMTNSRSGVASMCLWLSSVHLWQGWQIHNILRLDRIPISVAALDCVWNFSWPCCRLRCVPTAIEMKWNYACFRKLYHCISFNDPAGGRSGSWFETISRSPIISGAQTEYLLPHNHKHIPFYWHCNA